MPEERNFSTPVRTVADTTDQRIKALLPQNEWIGDVIGVDYANRRVDVNVRAPSGPRFAFVMSNVDIGTQVAPKLFPGNHVQIKELNGAPFITGFITSPLFGTTSALSNSSNISGGVPALQTPQNFTIVQIGTTIQANWSPVQGAAYYELWQNTVPTPIGASIANSGLARTETTSYSWQINPGVSSSITITNPGFESGTLVGWVNPIFSDSGGSAGWTINNTAPYVHGGLYSAKYYIIGNPTLPLGLINLTSVKYGIVPSTSYTFSAWAISQGAIAGTGDVALSLNVRDASGVNISTPNINFPATPANTWVFATGSTTLLANAATIEVQAFAFPGNIYFDDISVVGLTPINVTSLFYAVRAVGPYGSVLQASPFSQWLQPVVQTSALGAPSSAHIQGDYTNARYVASTYVPDSAGWSLNAATGYRGKTGDLGYTRLDATLVNGANHNVSTAGASYLRVTGPTAAFNITGFANGYNGKFLVVENDTTQNMTLSNNNVGSSAANRLLTQTGADTLLTGRGMAILIYDSNSSLWQLITVYSTTGVGAPVGAPYVTIGNDPTLTAERALVGTTNQVVVTDGGANASVTLSTPQNIHTGANVQFAQVNVGATNQIGDAIEVHALAQTGVSIQEWAAITGGSSFSVRHSRGATVGTQGALLANDRIGGFLGSGSDGTTFLNAAQVRMEADGNASAGVMPGRMVLLTSTTNSLVEAMRIDSAQRLTIGGTANQNGDQLEIHTLTQREVMALAGWGGANATPISMVVSKSRGTTVGSFGGLATDDVIFKLTGRGSITASIASAAEVSFEADGTFNTQSPGRIVFRTTPAASTTLTERVRIDSNAQIVLADAVNFVFGTTTGTKIGTGTTQKIGFYGNGPVAQATVTGAKAGNAALGSLLTALANLGLIVDSSGA